jgi:hypothetical protein
MLLKTSFGLVILACLCFPKLAEAQGNLVVNGGFDTSATGWTLAGVSYDSKYGDPAGDLSLPGGTASASQTINGLVAGTTYIVSGNYQGTVGVFSTGPNFEVTMNGAIIFETVSSGNNNWDYFSVPYTASSVNAVLSFGVLDEPSEGYGIDNISMQAVPESSTSTLITLGVGAVCVYARKRKWLCF